ncbi:MAG: cyclic nucleotide-binding domain-containing protein [Actinomycetota bacterium]|jgi:CRP-like cAMP-binding protein|nr:cyclic nucleotide-binding domain-containing protein [Actinomycetota bacterium]
MRKADKVEALARLALLEHCTRRDLTALASVAVEEDFPPGAVLTREGQRGGLAFVLLSGAASARRGNRRIATIRPGEIVGEMSLIDGAPRSATVTADDAVRALAINVDDFRALVGRSPRFTAALLRTLAGRIRDADRKGELRH